MCMSLAILVTLFLFHCPAIHATTTKNITIAAVDRSILYTPTNHWVRKDHTMLAITNQSFAVITFTGIAFYYHDIDIPLHGCAYKFSLDNGTEAVWTSYNRSGITSQEPNSLEPRLIYSSTGLINARHTVKITFEPSLDSPIRVGYFTYTPLKERTYFQRLYELVSGEDTQMASSDQHLIDSYNRIAKRCHDLRIALGIVGGLWALLFLYALAICRAPSNRAPRPKPKPNLKPEAPNKIPEEAMQSGRD